MIRAIANKRLDITDDEFEYFNELNAAFGEISMSKLFKSDKNGIITSITPSLDDPTSMVLIFFFLNVMMNQRLRRMEVGLDRLADLENRISKLENNDGAE